MPSDYDIRAPYALMNDAGDIVEIQLHRVEYDVEQTIKAILEFNGFTHAQFWGKLRAAILKTGSDIPMNRFWQHAREIGGGVCQRNTFFRCFRQIEFFIFCCKH